MNTRLAGALGLFLSLPAALWCQSTAAPTVRFHTNLGDIDVNLLSSTPKTVANFLNYMNKGSFNNSIIHRSVPGFIFQGGGYQWTNNAPAEIPQDPPVPNEYGILNARGTLAMAKLGGNPNSATDQWFFNVGNNSTILNSQNNGGFTVFGRVANAASLAVMDKIAAVPVPTGSNSQPLFSSPFDEMPLINYKGGTAVTTANLVLVLSVTQLETAPVIAANGIISAGSFGAYSAAAPGSFIEIYGSNLAGTTRGWADSDFTAGAAPTSLDSVSVSINGVPAYVNYVSPGQVNVQVPADVPTGGQVSVIVTSKGVASAPVMLSIKPVAGGLLAPPTFKVGDKQYVVAVHSKDGSFVSNGSIPGFPAAPAVPGEVITFYGIGFGPVTPTTAQYAGQVAQGLTALSTSLQFNIGTLPGQISYAGLVSGLVGVYQFNVAVPANAANGDLPVEVVLGGETVPQTLFLSVQK